MTARFRRHRRIARRGVVVLRGFTKWGLWGGKRIGRRYKGVGE